MASAGTDLGGGCRGCTPPLRWPAAFEHNWYSAKKKKLHPLLRKIVDPPLKWLFNRRSLSITSIRRGSLRRLNNNDNDDDDNNKNNNNNNNNNNNTEYDVYIALKLYYLSLAFYNNLKLKI